MIIFDIIRQISTKRRAIIQPRQGGSMMYNDYEINSATQAIIPINDRQTKIYEEESEYIIEKPANKIIDYNCNFYGSSYDGRCEGTRSLIGIKSKVPIIIEESREIIFFPTNSVKKKQSSWIALNKIDSFHKNDKNSYIVFKDGRKLDLDISVFSLENQYCRAIMLKSKLSDRILKEK